MKVYKCDGFGCKSENKSLEAEGWLIIGSKDGQSLCMKNQLPNNQFSHMLNYTDLHFCSTDCFVGRFIEKSYPLVHTEFPL